MVELAVIIKLTVDLSLNVEAEGPEPAGRTELKI